MSEAVGASPSPAGPTLEVVIPPSSDAVLPAVFRDAEQVGEALREELAACWAETANTGGAVGFPWPPVALAEAREAVDVLLAQIDAGRTILVVAHDPQGLAGWVSLDLNDHALVAHWATVRRLQTHPRARRRGIGRLLMEELAGIARAEGLEQLHLAVRGGMGLEDFYRRLGWHVVGAWPRALRLSPDDRRDEVLMMLALTPDREDP